MALTPIFLDQGGLLCLARKNGENLVLYRRIFHYVSLVALVALSCIMIGIAPTVGGSEYIKATKTVLEWGSPDWAYVIGTTGSLLPLSSFMFNFFGSSFGTYKPNVGNDGDLTPQQHKPLDAAERSFNDGSACSGEDLKNRLKAIDFFFLNKSAKSKIILIDLFLNTCSTVLPLIPVILILVFSFAALGSNPVTAPLLIALLVFTGVFLASKAFEFYFTFRIDDNLKEQKRLSFILTKIAAENAAKEGYHLSDKTSALTLKSVFWDTHLLERRNAYIKFRKTTSEKIMAICNKMGVTVNIHGESHLLVDGPFRQDLVNIDAHFESLAWLLDDKNYVAKDNSRVESLSSLMRREITNSLNSNNNGHSSYDLISTKLIQYYSALLQNSKVEQFIGYTSDRVPDSELLDNVMCKYEALLDNLGMGEAKQAFIEKRREAQLRYSLPSYDEISHDQLVQATPPPTYMPNLVAQTNSTDGMAKQSPLGFAFINRIRSCLC